MIVPEDCSIHYTQPESDSSIGRINRKEVRQVLFCGGSRSKPRQLWPSGSRNQFKRGSSLRHPHRCLRLQECARRIWQNCRAVPISKSSCCCLQPRWRFCAQAIPRADGSGLCNCTCLSRVRTFIYFCFKRLCTHRWHELPINRQGAFNFAQRSIPLLLAAREASEYPPTLIFTGATASLKGSANFAAFASGKFALRALAQSLAREFGPQGLHVSHTIIDGVIDIPRTKAWVFEHEDAKLNPDAVSYLSWAMRYRCWCGTDCGFVLAFAYSAAYYLCIWAWSETLYREVVKPECI